MQFDIVTCTLSERDGDGFVRCQPDPYGQDGTAPTHEAFLPFGLGGRPKAPTNGRGAHLLLMRHGDETMVIPGHDPRWMGSRPDFGDGGACLVSTKGTADAPTSPYVAFFGEGAAGGEVEGLFRVLAKTTAGDAKIEIDPATGDVTITHPAGTVAIVKATGVELGAAGGQAVALATPIIAWAATVETRLATLGQSGTAPVGVAATKVNAT